LALWVIFIHIGGDFPQFVMLWRASSLSMMAFFMIAGFQLSASTARPVVDAREFYKNRIVAAHPLYMLAVAFATPATYLIRAELGKTTLDVVKDFLLASFYQGAWPWGIDIFTSIYGPLWFSSAYIFCILCFPFMHRWLHDRRRAPLGRCRPGTGPADVCCARPCTAFSCWPVCGCYGAITVVNASIFSIAVFDLASDPPSPGAFDWGTAAYAFPPSWAAIFFMGCMTWHLFELNGQQGRSRHWGKVADGLTLLIALVHLVLLPLLGADLATAVGGVLSRPGRLSMAALSVWIYALATGQGFVARCLRNGFLLKYLAPASYAMFLFHLPLAAYLIILFPSLSPNPGPLGHWWLYFVVASLTVPVAMLAQHVLNGPLTMCFLRCLVSCGCCGGRAAPGKEETTLGRVVQCIHGLSGADVDGSWLLADCGLDSFGTAALLGVLKARIPDVRLTAIQIYQLETVGELAEKIDEGRGVPDSCGSNCSTGTPSDDGSSSGGAVRRRGVQRALHRCAAGA
jgi:hypothetical protein